MFKNVLNYESPDKILKYLHSLETTDDYNQATCLIEESFINFGGEARIMSKSNKKNKGTRIWNIVSNILNFTLKEQKIGQELKILTPDQMLSNYFTQLKAGNNSEKLKNEIRQLLYSLYRSKTLKKLYKTL